MLRLIAALYRDEVGFIVSAELVLIATITILTMVVGLAEVSYSINSELKDVSSAFDSLNQTYSFYDEDGNGYGYWEDDGQGGSSYNGGLDLAGASAEQ